MKIARLIRKRHTLVYNSLLIAAALCSTQALAQGDAHRGPVISIGTQSWA
jgi:hypothetical protein